MTKSNVPTPESTHDATHSQSGAAHGAERPSYEDINIPVIVLVSLVAGLITIVLIAFVEGLTYHWQRDIVQQRGYEMVDRPVEDLITAQREALRENPERRILSIEDAIERVLQQHASSGRPETSDDGLPGDDALQMEGRTNEPQVN